jgi:hypothetical protein
MDLKLITSSQVSQLLDPRYYSQEVVKAKVNPFEHLKLTDQFNVSAKVIIGILTESKLVTKEQMEVIMAYSTIPLMESPDEESLQKELEEERAKLSIKVKEEEQVREGESFNSTYLESDKLILWKDN